MQVTLYVYNLTEKRIRGKGNLDVEFFEKDFVECIKTICAKKPIDKKYNLEGANKVIYLSDYKYDREQHLLFLNFKSAEYGLVRKVVNTDTLAEDPKKKKGRKDGDEESTSMIIKFETEETSKKAVCLLQVNARGVSLNKILEYINVYVGAIHMAHEDGVKYCVRYANVVSRDFLKALENTQRIKSVKMIVDADGTDASEFKDFASSDDVSEDFEIIYKPSKAGKGIEKNTVKKFFQYYNSHSDTIKKIRVDSSSIEGNPLSFDTEKMKEKVHITVSDTLNGEPNVDELEIEMRRKINEY